jgi:hypothetical protein
MLDFEVRSVEQKDQRTAETKERQTRDAGGRWKTPPMLEEARWPTSRPRNAKAEEARAQRLNEELNQELAAEFSDPTLRRRKRLKASIVALISEYSKDYGPMLRSQVYETLHGGRHKDIFSKALRELLEDNEILQTELRNGPRGRLGIAYVPYVPMPED